MDDLIKRKDAERALTALGAQLSEKHTRTVVKCIRAVHDIPAVDTEPVRHAKWVWNNDAMDWNIGAWVCSECGGGNENIHARKPNGDKCLASNPYVWSGSQFCPNFGAKMDGGAKDA